MTRTKLKSPPQIEPTVRTAEGNFGTEEPTQYLNQRYIEGIHPIQGLKVLWVRNSARKS